MKMKQIVLSTIVLIATAVLAVAQAAKQSAESRELTETIARMDALIFDAFNAHNVDALMALFTDDLEFYHDKGGLTNKQQTREGFAGMFGRTPDIRRELVKGSLGVYPIKDYGAIEVGTHRFCHKENGKDDCGNFPFIMTWQKIGDSWKISRVISYGH
jgi:ketosteroid isomerase-like protein